MIKLFVLMIFFFIGNYSLKAADAPGGNDQEFTAKLDSIKNPFEDGLPKPVVIMPKPAAYHEEPKPVVLPMPKSPPMVEVVKLPDLKLQGVMVGEDIHQAIIDDQVVPLFGTIEGVRVDSVTKQGVGLSYKGKKFFLKVD